MNMVEDVLGSYGSNLIFAIVGVGVALICLAVALWLIKRRGGSAPFIRGGRNRQPRLQVLDAAAVDARRRLVLVRRDNVEHLVMIGGPTDIVIESGIGAIPVITPIEQRENFLPNSHYDNEPQQVEKREAPRAILQPREVTHEPVVKTAPAPIATPAPVITPPPVITPAPVASAPAASPAPTPTVTRENIATKPAPVVEPAFETPRPVKQEPPVAAPTVAPVIEKPPVVAAATPTIAAPVVAPPDIAPPIKPAAVTQTVEPAPILQDPRFSLNETDAGDILETARNRVLPDREVEPPVRPAAPAPAQTLSNDALSSDFEKFLEAEMAKSRVGEPQEAEPTVATQQPVRREPTTPPISGASTENEIQKEMARIFGEMSVTRDR